MKIARVIVWIFTVLLALMLFWTAGVINMFRIGDMTRTRFSQEQRDEICRVFQFELAPGEALETRFGPGFGPDRIRLTVTVRGVASEEDFMKRLGAPVIPTTEDLMPESILDLFPSEAYGWERRCTFQFEDGAATFYVIGYFPQLQNIYEFLYNPWQPILTNPYIISGLTFEFAFILFLVLTKAIHKRRAK
jgi:hypothetical protein